MAGSNTTTRSTFMAHQDSVDGNLSMHRSIECIPLQPGGQYTAPRFVKQALPMEGSER